MPDQSPWISVWTRPRETIRLILQNPKQSIWILAFIYGINSLLNVFQSYPLALHTGIGAMVLITLVVAPFWGYLFFYIWSKVVFWCGKLLKGEGDFPSIRAAYAWSCVPLTGNLPLWILLIFFYSRFLFFGTQDQVVNSGSVLLLFLILIGKLVFSIWAIVLYLQMLSEVQQFSILRAIANVVIAFLFLGIALGLLWFIALMINPTISTNSSVSLEWQDISVVVQQLINKVMR